MSEQRRLRAALRAFFAGLVSDELLEAYWKLLAEGYCPKDDVEALFGDLGLLDALVASEMARLQSSGRTRPAVYVCRTTGDGYPVAHTPRRPTRPGGVFLYAGTL